MNRRIVPASALALATLFSTFASAAEKTHKTCRDYLTPPDGQPGFVPCFYAGIGLGLSHLRPNTSDSVWHRSDSTDTTLALYGGYHFARDWFVETRYAHLGKARLKSDDPAITSEESISYDVLAVHAGYYLPFRISWSNDTVPARLFIKAGASYIHNSTSSSLVQLDNNKSLVAPSLGGGIEWQFAQRWMLRGDVDSFSSRSRMASVSIGYWFGGEQRRHYVPGIDEPAEQLVTTAPEPVQPAPEDIQAEPPVVHEIITFTAPDTHTRALAEGYLPAIYVNIDSAELSINARSALISLANALKTYPEARIVIQGHTDSTGSDAYNQALSERRAESVKRFLVDNGINAERLETQGFGSSKPVADNTTEQGRQLNRRIDFRILEK